MDGTLESVPVTQAPPPTTRKLRPLYSLLPYVRPYSRQIALALLFVLDHGRIVEQGRHAELIARGALYARLAALQFAA